ncbi:unnamed protein product [Closterium sp. NIES-65]|nr:unnamed protein product [Closterium sp. NIES-65]
MMLSAPVIPLRASSSPFSRVSPLDVFHPHFSVPSRPLHVPLGRYLPSVRTLRVACEARGEEREGLDQAAEDEAIEGSKPSGSDNEVVTAVSGAMARSFGGPLWFAVLLSSILAHLRSSVWNSMLPQHQAASCSITYSSSDGAD